MKKFFAAILATTLSMTLFVGCSPVRNPEALKTDPMADGYVKGKISDFSEYEEGTDAYRTVTTADEFIQAIADAKYHYKNVWDDVTGTYTQVPADGYTEENFKGTVHVIEIANDLDLGYKHLSKAVKDSGLVSNYDESKLTSKAYVPLSDMYVENGISQIKVENTSNLLVYSQSGAKITHCGFKLTSDTNVVFRNLEFDEIWQWEDTSDVSVSFAAGDYDTVGWAYFKISFCGYIWIDHCTFGKSYDGQIDISNPDYNANAGVAFRAPYGADGGNGVHISWCDFNAGSDDKDGYLYKMMEKIEQDYKDGGNHYLYYKALRDGGASFGDILYGLAIPQKKGFLCGDGSKEEYNYNLKLQISFANCKFTNLEDRIPKLRGGNAYMYNCVVDSSQYYGYRTVLKGISAASIVSSVNSKWKCALVSQGIVCGNGGSVMAEGCIFKGIETLLKNNDSGNGTSGSSHGGYKFENCIYQKTVGNDASISNGNTSTLKEDNFRWHTVDGLKPFTVTLYELNELEEILADEDYGAGVVGSYQNLINHI